MKRVAFGLALIGGFFGGCLWALRIPRPVKATDYYVPDGWRPRD